MTDSQIDELISQALARAKELKRLPVSTYRLQFHGEFTFRDAAAIVPYLAELGITHVYASPYLQARPGSTHGYDVVDHCKLNRELGTQADYDAFIDALTRHGMTHLLDTVPNHIGVSTDNAWWHDVLEHGPNSRFSDYFDITWNTGSRPKNKNKLLLPILGKPYGDVLDAGELKIEREDDRFVARYFQQKLPIAPETYPLIDAADPNRVEAIDKLFRQQHYRLCWWRTAPDEINYRRFFDVNDLAALKMERREVFEATQTYTLALAASGAVAGLRIDHPDGLYEPAGYFRRLQTYYLLEIARKIVEKSGANWDELRAPLLDRLESRPVKDEPLLYVVAEKILGPREVMPTDWPVYGTSGYDPLIKINSLYVDSSAENQFDDIYRAFTQEAESFEDQCYQNKKLILETSMVSEMNMLAHQLYELAQLDRHSLDFTLNGLNSALKEVIASFGVYRSYVKSEKVTGIDQAQIREAINCAADRNPRTPQEILEFIQSVLLQSFGSRFTKEQKAARLHFAGKFQQLTSPATAKGIEDTTFYRYNRLVTLNEVGGNPSQFGIEPAALHNYFQTRSLAGPKALTTLSTHDTKRSEDVRARISVLSEMPEQWQGALDRWQKLNERFESVVGGISLPVRNEQYMLYQNLLGAWPLNVDADWPTFVERMQAFALKSMRESKQFTLYAQPNEPHEAAMKRYLAALLDRTGNAEFWTDFTAFQKTISYFGQLNSLSQTVLKLTAPGVPDTYQGTELWDYSLVDPDNRRPVDYALRRRLLASLSAKPHLRELLTEMDDGRIKLALHQAALRLRKTHRELFEEGSYEPVEIQGALSAHLFAFMRRRNDAAALVVVPRLLSKMMNRVRELPVGAVWKDTRLNISPERIAALRHLLTQEPASPTVSELLRAVPFGIWS